MAPVNRTFKVERVKGRTTPLDLTNFEFGRLKVEAFIGTRHLTTKGGAVTSHRFWRCRCICTKEVEASSTRLLNGTKTSCGCLVGDTVNRLFLKHGLSVGSKPDPVYRMFHSAKERCGKSGREFNISLEDIKIPKQCPLLGIDLVLDNDNTSWNSPTLDRIDSTRGYSPDNVWVISHRANRSKSDATAEEVLKVLVAVELRTVLGPLPAGDRLPRGVAAKRNPLSRMVYSARRRSKADNLECTLYPGARRIPAVCPALGIPLHVNNKPGSCAHSPTIDRIDPTKGYTLDNTWVISHRANTIKNELSLQELRTLAFKYREEMTRRKEQNALA